MGAMENAKRLRPGIIVMAAVGVAAALLYGWFLSVDLASALGGEARMAQGYEALAALLWLWIALFALVVVDRVLGGTSWTRRAGYLLVPLAGIATLFATDYPSKRLCQIAVLALPPLVGGYALLGRLPARLAGRAQALALLPMAVLSAYVVRLFMS